MGCLGTLLVDGLTLGFSSRHGLTVHGFKPRIRLCEGTVEYVWYSPSHISVPSHLCALSQNK